MAMFFTPSPIVVGFLVNCAKRVLKGLPTWGITCAYIRHLNSLSRAHSVKGHSVSLPTWQLISSLTPRKGCFNVGYVSSLSFPPDNWRYTCEHTPKNVRSHVENVAGHLYSLVTSTHICSSTPARRLIRVLSVASPSLNWYTSDTTFEYTRGRSLTPVNIVESVFLKKPAWKCTELFTQAGNSFYVLLMDVTRLMPPRAGFSVILISILKKRACTGVHLALRTSLH